MTIIETVALRKDWGERAAVDGVSISVPEGAVFALVGPNGAGKTTLLRMLAGLTEPTSGRAELFGLDLALENRRVQRRLSFLPDFYELYRDLSIEEYLQYFARAYRIDPALRDQRIDSVLVKVKLADRADSPIDSLSRGMRQRVAIGRSLLHDPALLLFDEPASGLDPEARQDLQQLFKDLAAEGRTMVVSSHILTELEEYCTHVAIMQKGRLVASGPISEFHSRQAVKRAVRVRIDSQAPASERERVLTVLLALQHVSGARLEGLELRCEIAGGDAEQAGVLRALVQAGLPVCAFESSKGAMQEIYMSMMKGTSE